MHSLTSSPIQLPCLETPSTPQLLCSRSFERETVWGGWKCNKIKKKKLKYKKLQSYIYKNAIQNRKWEQKTYGLFSENSIVKVEINFSNNRYQTKRQLGIHHFSFLKTWNCFEKSLPNRLIRASQVPTKRIKIKTCNGWWFNSGSMVCNDGVSS